MFKCLLYRATLLYINTKMKKWKHQIQTDFVCVCVRARQQRAGNGTHGGSRPFPASSRPAQSGREPWSSAERSPGSSWEPEGGPRERRPPGARTRAQDSPAAQGRSAGRAEGGPRIGVQRTGRREPRWGERAERGAPAGGGTDRERRSRRRVMTASTQKGRGRGERGVS